MRIADTSIRRPVLAVMTIGGLVVLGWISLGRLGIDLFPNVEFPYVSVITTLEGAGPDTIETEVTDVIEENVNNISGVKQLRSVSSEGYSQVNIEFELDEDVDVKAQDVRDKTALAQQNLPIDVDQPIVDKVDPDAAPILSIVIASDMAIGELTTFADEVVKEAVQRVPGVGSVTLVGGREREMRIWLDASRMRAHGVTAAEVVNAISSEHIEIPGGRLEIDGSTREFGVKTIAEALIAEDFRNLVVRFNAGQPPTRIRDFARVEDGLQDERTFAQLNGRPGISLDVRRQSGRNTVEVAHAVKAEVEKLRSIAPTGVDIVIARDISRFIESSISDVLKDLLIAVALVVLITYFFLLSWQATLIVATAIPASLIATFFMFYVFGFTINMLTLLALTVAIGLLVDDAIVVIESIQRDVDKGVEPFEAASTGTHRVGLAVFAATFATLAVFVPIAFMSGVVGRFFLQYGLAIVFSVSVSLLVALTLTPMLSARFLKPVSSHWKILRPIEAFHVRLETGYGSLIHYAIRYRYLVLIAAFGSLIVGGWFAGQIPSGFTSKADRSEFQGAIELPIGHGIGESRLAAARIQDALSGVPEVVDIFVTAGSGRQAKVNQLDLYVLLTPKQERSLSQFEIIDLARAALAEAVPMAMKSSLIEVPWISGGGLSTADIEYVVRGSDLDEINAYVEPLMTAMRESGAFVDVRSTYEFGRPELQIVVDRLRAGDLGVSARDLATTSRVMIGGIDAGTFESGGKRYDVRVRLEEPQRQNLRQLEQVQVRSATGALIDLRSLADLRIATGPAQIDRQDRARKISILANSGVGMALGESIEALDELIVAQPLPAGMTSTFEGMARRLSETKTVIAFAFMLALIALYMVLASQFDRFAQPLVIMLTAPLSFSGAFAALYFADQEMSMFAQIGLIALMGIVMKNGILLVDRANQLVAEGAGLEDAIMHAGPERLRPVLMTAFAAVFAMLPVALTTSDGAEWRNSMGFIIIGGLSSSTLLTLLVVPAAYVLPADLRQFRLWVSSKFRSAKAT
ncbi:MAG: efflux RND transporter permease subunit [Gammaproteobacteria bacterium]|nr:efflux RND transporter permease subunit [Gammaproteobacteria bacterium]NNL46684.1 efflux RND transporter permease subunit [Woeseiaceae bacterium]